MRIYRTPSRIIFEAVNYTLFTIFSISIVLPFVHVFAISFSSPLAVIQNRVTVFPVEFSTTAYRLILTSQLFLRSLANTSMLTVVKTILSISFALAAGFALANKNFVGGKLYFVFIIIPLYFSGGLIPTYILVNSYGLNNTYGALILPNLVSIFYIIVFRNAIMRLPAEMTESAEIDGASEFTILFRIILPLIIPMVMAFTIFSAVAYWNEWFNVLIYVRDQDKWTLQYMLRTLYLNPSLGNFDQALLADEKINPQNVIMAAILCTVLPIIIIYPFLQRYFIHGVIVGAVKG